MTKKPNSCMNGSISNFKVLLVREPLNRKMDGGSPADVRLVRPDPSQDGDRPALCSRMGSPASSLRASVARSASNCAGAVKIWEDESEDKENHGVIGVRPSRDSRGQRIEPLRDPGCVRLVKRGSKQAAATRVRTATVQRRAHLGR